MRGAAILAIAAVTLAPYAAVGGDVRHSGFPDAFYGRWAPNAKACKDTDKSAIVLSANSYENSDATCIVDWVTETASARGSVFSAHLQCTNRLAPAQKGAGTLIVRPDTLIQISVGPDFDNLNVYQRCGKQP
jgi:hypothetical protein